MIYMERTTRSISQFKKRWDSNFGTLNEAVLESDAFDSNCPKQMKFEDEEVEWKCYPSSNTFQIPELSNHHCYAHFEQLRFSKVMAPIQWNRCRWWFMEDESKRIKPIDGEFVEKSWKVVMKFLMNFGENGGKVS
jgi:hypothetical protein